MCTTKVIKRKARKRNVWGGIWRLAIVLAVTYTIGFGGEALFGVPDHDHVHAQR